MKLRNKKTGEIIDIKDALYDSDDYPNHYTIRDDWEDYEEPKEYWFINDLDGKPMKCELRYCPVRDFDDWSEKRKKIGNRFKTEEECEKAAEKIEALTRLKDKGFKILGFYSKDKLIADSDKKWEFIIKAEIDSSVLGNEDDCKMIGLLFGGEE